MRIERNACNVWWAKLTEGDAVEDPKVGKRITFQWAVSN
jgi:hypothetical protein